MWERIPYAVPRAPAEAGSQGRLVLPGLQSGGEEKEIALTVYISFQDSPRDVRI